MEFRWFKFKDQNRLALQALIQGEWVGIPVVFEDPSQAGGFFSSKPFKKPYKGKPGNKQLKEKKALSRAKKYPIVEVVG